MKDYMRDQYLEFAKQVQEEADTHLKKAKECSDTTESSKEIIRALTLTAAASDLYLLAGEGTPFRHFFRRWKLNKMFNDLYKN